ncbi:serine hydrolase domain-containing protein [Corallococcus macrosporus]|uniref:Beta lactamase family protein n=1 Tax=Myxococcus fulvus (strain ATCC BAA-855 / HW-1) TaxID=483219 RepID=F8CME7_MYXFH|nr:serine hydrolase domain-containing protein [Corallococcus macrosporus]AEI64014.1 beta lactamase family protein [Corallococcus macrosporus]
MRLAFVRYGAVVLLGLAAPASLAAPRPALEMTCEPAGLDPEQVPRAFSAEVRGALDAVVRAELSQGPVAGLSVGVTRGAERWVCAYGLRDVARKLPATPRTTYRMASVTKSFTAVAVLQLVEQGKLSLDADISTLVESYPARQWPVTVRDLLGHVSGVPTYDGFASSRNTKVLSTKAAIAVFAGKPLAFEPRTRYLYTTWGYNLLGAAVEKASGQSYRDYLREHLFAPAGMHHADLDVMATRDAHQAKGYRVLGGALRPSRYLDVSSRFAGGGTRATVGDMLAFGRAVLAHTLVTRETMGRMQASMATTDGRLTDYGMGFATYPVRGHYVVAHAGGQPETSTMLVMLPAEDTVIALATNVEGEARRMRRLSIRLMEHLVDDAVTRREAYVADPVDAVVYEGLSRVASYGLAYHQWATRGPGALPPASDLPGAFTRVSALLNRKEIGRDARGALERVRSGHEPRQGAAFIHAGAYMARTLEKLHGAERLKAYAVEGPLAFFSDYLAACDAQRVPEPERFGEPLRADVLRLSAAWKRTQLPALRRVRLDEEKNPEPHWAAVRESVAASPGFHPDYSDELLRIADGHAWRKQPAARRRWLERAVELQPRGVDARWALAEALLAANPEAVVLPHLREAVSTPQGALALAPKSFLKRLYTVPSTAVAAGLLRAGVALHPDAPELWEALAKRERSLGRKAAATAALREAKRAREAPRPVVAPAPALPASTGASGAVPDDHGLEPAGK